VAVDTKTLARPRLGVFHPARMSKLILFAEASLRQALNDYIDHHHFEGTTRVRATFSSSLLQTNR